MSLSVAKGKVHLMRSIARVEAPSSMTTSSVQRARTTLWLMYPVSVASSASSDGGYPSRIARVAYPDKPTADAFNRSRPAIAARRHGETNITRVFACAISSNAIEIQGKVCQKEVRRVDQS
jgi:hypothetical protein